MDANKTVVATFTEIAVQQFSLNVGVVGPGSITLNPAGGVYNVGTVVTVTASADAGFVFGGWSGDLSGNVTPTTITMNSDKNVTASFISTGGGGGGPVVYEETTTGGATEANVVATIGNVTAVSGNLYLASIVTKNQTDVVSVSGLGLTWALVKAQCSGRGNTGVEIWMAIGNPSGDGVVTATLGSNAL